MTGDPFHETSTFADRSTPSNPQYHIVSSRFALFAERAADSSSRVPDDEGALGRRIETLQPDRTRCVARGHHSLEDGTANTSGLRRRTIRSAGTEVDPVEFHSAADDGGGSLFL